MELSIRLKSVAAMVDKCRSIADIGTDHGYIPIFLIMNNLIEEAVASDINPGPLQRAKSNISFEGFQHKIECRLGGGLSTIKPGEVDAAVISGMGGYLIKDILEEGLEVFKYLDYIILQPVQYPEIIREYIYKNGFKIIDEDICFEDNKFYEIIKVSYNTTSEDVDDIFYEISKILFEKKHPIIKEFIFYKIKKYKNICDTIKESSLLGKTKKINLLEKVKKLEELSKCL